MTVLILAVFMATFVGHMAGVWLERRRGEARYDERVRHYEGLLSEERSRTANLTALSVSERPQDFAAWKNLLDRPDPVPEERVHYLHDDFGFINDEVPD